MIHQLIFANPKPGMTPQEFQDYWIGVHARDYAGKIPQIKKYKVNRVLTLNDKPIYQGMAEIWLENEREQLASLQSDEFVHGAREDEPRWAAFWESLCLDTDAHVLADGAETRHKLVLLFKRRLGIPLSVFRRYAKDSLGTQLAALPGASKALLCSVKDGYYAVGEARFDAAFQLWFEDVAAIERAQSSAQYQEFLVELQAASEPNALFRFVCEENIII